MTRAWSYALVLLSVLGASPARATAADALFALPPPTGPHAVGRVTVHWTDASRGDVLATSPGAHRELVVDVWYPAAGAVSIGSASYLPDLAAMQRAVGEAGLREHFGAAYEAVAKGRVQTHAVENAPFARRAGPSPVLVFSHGFGNLSRTYTAQLEDLASHGYVVAAIAHTYDTMATVFPDGRAVSFATEAWKARTATEEASIAYGRERLRWWADDIRFVLDEVERHDRRGGRFAPFGGHLDLRRVGALGHSSGGRAAAAVCRDDRRFRACLNQDGLVMMQPYERAAGRGLARSFLLFVRPPPPWPPPEAELAKMGLTLKAAEALVTKLRAEQDAAMQGAGRGSFRVTLATPGISHMSFSDLAILQAAGDAAERDRAIRNLETIRAYTRAFFDKSLRGARATVLDAAGADEGVKVERFPKP
jgi:hypothetical protein